VDDDTRTSVEKLAYAYWQQRGCPIGSPEIDWFRAEQQLAGETVSESYGEAETLSESYSESETNIVIDDEGHISSTTIPVTSDDRRPLISVTALP
jgi:hypothetical protein